MHGMLITAGIARPGQLAVDSRLVDAWWLFRFGAGFERKRRQTLVLASRRHLIPTTTDGMLLQLRCCSRRCGSCMSGIEPDGDWRRRLSAGLANVGRPSRLPMSTRAAGPGAGPRCLPPVLVSPTMCSTKASELIGRAFLAYLPKSRLSNDNE